MKVHGATYDKSRHCLTDACKAAIDKQNGKKMRALRAAALQKQGLKKSERMRLADRGAQK